MKRLLAASLLVLSVSIVTSAGEIPGVPKSPPCEVNCTSSTSNTTSAVTSAVINLILSLITKA